jgi:hypothetical protein
MRIKETDTVEELKRQRSGRDKGTAERSKKETQGRGRQTQEGKKKRNEKRRKEEMAHEDISVTRCGTGAEQAR